MWVAVSVCGCDATGTYGDYCDILCDCASCDSAERAQCKDFGKDWEQRARDKSCDGELAEFFGCVNAYLTCVDGRTDFGVGQDECSDERSALPIECNPFEVQQY